MTINGDIDFRYHPALIRVCWVYRCEATTNSLQLICYLGCNSLMVWRDGVKGLLYAVTTRTHACTSICRRAAVGGTSYREVLNVFSWAQCSVTGTMGYSIKCEDLKTYWDGTQCVLCDIEPGRSYIIILFCSVVWSPIYIIVYNNTGHEVTPNCGHSDDGSQHVLPNLECKVNTFNDGSSAYCQPCASCPPGYNISSPCNTTTDTKCEGPR